MKVEVDLFATLADFLPPSSRGSHGMIDVPEDCTIADLAARLGIPPELPWIALVNGHEAPGDQRLSPDDVVSMFPPLAGGSNR